jgi:hypothetical protein
MLLYTFTAYSSLYELYVAILGSVISIAIFLSVLVSLDRLWHVLKCFGFLAKAKLTGRKPEDAFTPQPLPDPVYEGHLFPKVAVQLPMFNERAVCQAVIDSACEMVWPRSRFKVQVSSFVLTSSLPQCSPPAENCHQHRYAWKHAMCLRQYHLFNLMTRVSSILFSFACNQAFNCTVSMSATASQRQIFDL